MIGREDGVSTMDGSEDRTRMRTIARVVILTRSHCDAVQASGERDICGGSGGRQAAMRPVFFPTASDLRRWFEANYTSAQELWLGYYKNGSGKPSVTWPESIDEALCVGWIDGIRKSIDDKSYKIRFTPRKKGSIWSAVNTRRARELVRQKRMRLVGRKAFAARREFRSGIYSYEQRPAQLPEPYRSIFKKKRPAWTFFESQPPGYQKTVSWWIVSAKREETRLKRLRRLIEFSSRGRRIPLLSR